MKFPRLIFLQKSLFTPYKWDHCRLALNLNNTLYLYLKPPGKGEIKTVFGQLRCQISIRTIRGCAIFRKFVFEGVHVRQIEYQILAKLIPYTGTYMLLHDGGEPYDSKAFIIITGQLFALHTD